jgi:hypothetical protein
LEEELQERASMLSRNCDNTNFGIETGESSLMEMMEMWNEVRQLGVTTDAGQWASYQQAGEFVEPKTRSWTWWDCIV